MITLCLETSFKYMGVVLIKDDQVLSEIMLDCFKKQSEYLIPKIDEILKENKISKKEINQIVITKGPGSYTGVRIAMTFAKTISVLSNIPIYTISTLRLYSNGLDGASVLDARSNRAYVGLYQNSKTIFEGVLELEEVVKKTQGLFVFGDGHLVNKEDNYLPIGQCFLNTKEYWEKVDNIHSLVPEYYKGIEGYKAL